MDRIKGEAVMQVSFDEDMNLAENKPDCAKVCFSRGCVEITDTKILADQVRVLGNLHFQVLYYTGEKGCALVKWEGKLPLEEKLHVEGVKPADLVTVNGNVEDLTVSMINSRKLNIRSVVTLEAACEELYDEEITIGIHSKEPVEYRRSVIAPARIVVQKKDVFRWKEEFPVPGNYPNIFQILWTDLLIKDMEYKIMDGRLGVQGEVRAFVLYEAEGDSGDVYFFERTIPFSGVLECQGCREGGFADIRYEISQKDFAIRPNEDGEERNVGLDLTLELNMHIYEEDQTELISDIYGVTCQVNSKCKDTFLRKIQGKVNGKMKLSHKIRVRGKSGGILQVMHPEGNVYVEETRIVQQGLQISGVFCVKILFITGEDAMPYSFAEEQIPFQYVLEMSNLQKEDMCKVQAGVEQLQVQLLDGEEMEVRTVLGMDAMVFRPLPVKLVQEAETLPVDQLLWSSIPSILIYIVKPGDTLWDIGKRYFIPVEQIKRLNHLESDLIMPGQKLFLVKGGIEKYTT